MLYSYVFYMGTLWSKFRFFNWSLIPLTAILMLYISFSIGWRFKSRALPQWHFGVPWWGTTLSLFQILRNCVLRDVVLFLYFKGIALLKYNIKLIYIGVRLHFGMTSSHYLQKRFWYQNLYLSTRSVMMLAHNWKWL